MSVIKLRDYQHELIKNLASALKECRRVVGVMPTGTGKMLVAAEIIRRVSKNKKVVLFVAHRRELINQIKNNLDKMGIEYGEILPEVQTKTACVYVATIQTLTARAKKYDYLYDQISLIVIDEAHHAASLSYKKLLNRCKKSKCIGLTATPIRGTGQPLGEVFEKLVQGITYQDAIKDGYLVKPNYYVPISIDLTDVKTKGRDYDPESLDKKMTKSQLIGDVVSNVLRLAQNKKAVIFATSVKHSIYLWEEFQKAGVKAWHVDADTPTEERDRMLERFKSGDIQVLCNAMIATEGVDIPAVECVALARPTKSLGLYLQMVGRGLRPQENKSCLVLDFAGCVDRFGFCENYEDWTLKTGSSNFNLKTQQKREAKELICNNCGYVFTRSRVCPECGEELPRKKRQAEEIETIEADLVALNEEEQKRLRELQEIKRLFYGECLAYCQQTKKKSGFAYHIFKHYYKENPPQAFPSKQVSPATLHQIKKYLAYFAIRRNYEKTNNKPVS